MLKEHIYFAKGMHCASCEILIEKKLLDLENVKSVDAKTAKGEVLIEYEGEKPPVDTLNKIFKKEKYSFSDSPWKENSQRGSLPKAIFIALIFIGIFLILNKMGISGLVNINSSSSLPVLFVFGLLAGVSSCAALVGGIVLSMSKQWLKTYSETDSVFQKLKPHLMFNAGRLISYAILGAALGVIGSQLKVAAGFAPFLVIAVSILMAVLGAQMLGVKAFKKFQFTAPKFVSRYVADEKNFKGRYLPFAMGALTFFLPCGFTISAQGIALLSGNPIHSALIMFFFALGTAPTLLAIGMSSIKLSGRPDLALQFSRAAGILVLFFALFNINSQLNVLGYSSLGDSHFLQAKTENVLADSNFPEIVNEKQLVKMDASASGYSPNYIKVRAGVPVRWEITDKGTSGCTNAIISKGLFPDQISLTPGSVSVKEFTPDKPGKYKFSCWMGMVSGTIEVVDASTPISAAAPDSDNQEIVPSGASGCGCGGNIN